jgi:catechol 2,3-dioxygenase-like lactoylglutathione lyase family enzyme
MTVVDITIHATFLPHNDPDASVAFYRDTLGFEARNPGPYNGATCRDLEGTTRAAKR